MKLIRNVTYILLIGLGLPSCYYDNGDDLYQFVNEPVCDTLSVSYSLFVFPLLDQHCISCHSGNTPSGNIALTTYSQIHDQASNGKLLGVLRHDPGFSAMPRGANKLADCEVNKVAAWISKGAENN